MPSYSVCRQFFGFVPSSVHVLQISSDDVHPVFPGPSRLSLAAPQFPLYSMTRYSGVVHSQHVFQLLSIFLTIHSNFLHLDCTKWSTKKTFKWIWESLLRFNIIHVSWSELNVELTAVVAEDALLLGAPVPDHDRTVLGASHHVAVLTDITLRPSDACHHVVVSKYRLYHRPWTSNTAPTQLSTITSMNASSIVFIVLLHCVQSVHRVCNRLMNRYHYRYL